MLKNANVAAGMILPSCQDTGTAIILGKKGQYVFTSGNDEEALTVACKEHGGFYLGSIGGPAAILALESIKHVEVIEYEELGMEAILRIDVEKFPAFIVVDDKGNDFFSQLS